VIAWKHTHWCCCCYYCCWYCVYVSLMPYINLLLHYFYHGCDQAPVIFVHLSVIALI